MKQALEQIFKSVQVQAEKNLEAARAGMLGDSKDGGVQGSGTENLDFSIDGKGNATDSVTQWGGGVTLKCEAWITSPDDTFSIKITGSDGGGGTWENVKTNQKIYFEIKTSFWHATTVAVSIEAKVARNVPGNAKLNYKY